MQSEGTCRSHARRSFSLPKYGGKHSCYNSINAESALGGSAGVIGRVSETWVGLDDSFERCDLQ